MIFVLKFKFSSLQGMIEGICTGNGMLRFYIYSVDLAFSSSGCAVFQPVLLVCKAKSFLTSVNHCRVAELQKLQIR